MLDDMQVLRRAVASYRTAAMAAGVPCPADGDRDDGPSLDALSRVFDVDHIDEQPISLSSRGLPYE
ncbi:hypothetical protein [Rugosimonospora africana]|uniref:Uncharacterized protein n=1 Tax=Rugosimonospora africana TaxID=556532 RepID=A0A8J3QXF8_9ACTN|nr:hypothetical protein [Rugosimonospora africana]GIH18949.1 hypothetical protein Raf01_71210 [Rugosimonospora africana]